ncbi:hypothetical protein [Aureivirga sp. CE67]|uniref:hypothetical protein n=1 Tax=Aureivirga sp. CE67 TaxID=1788983 RepID=UPI0018CB9A1F|nr:hypothetical protein [Aureivirga sp. CE67]
MKRILFSIILSANLFVIACSSKNILDESIQNSDKNKIAKVKEEVLNLDYSKEKKDYIIENLELRIKFFGFEKSVLNDHKDKNTYRAVIELLAKDFDNEKS